MPDLPHKINFLCIIVTMVKGESVYVRSRAKGQVPYSQSSL
jgi:hypothetical protein